VIRATLDTNVLASSAIARVGGIAVLFSRWRADQFELVVSDHIVSERARVLHKPYFAARLDVQDRAEFLALVAGDATVVAVAEPIPDVVSDPADNLVLATALSAGVPYLVSGDRELQRLAAYPGNQDPLSSRVYRHPRRRVDPFWRV